jgi:hypothetical protein
MSWLTVNGLGDQAADDRVDLVSLRDLRAGCAGGYQPACAAAGRLAQRLASRGVTVPSVPSAAPESPAGKPASKPSSAGASAIAQAAKAARTSWVSLPDEPVRDPRSYPVSRPWNWKPTALGLAGIATVIFVLFRSGGRRS